MIHYGLDFISKMFINYIHDVSLERHPRNIMDLHISYSASCIDELIFKVWRQSCPPTLNVMLLLGE
jgi:hypothetical protein